VSTRIREYADTSLAASVVPPMAGLAETHRVRKVSFSPFVTVRYPDEAWELTPIEKVPKVGDRLWRSGGKWVVSKTVEDSSGHVIVTWRPASAAD
jgi:hypothetical protein